MSNVPDPTDKALWDLFAYNRGKNTYYLKDQVTPERILDIIDARIKDVQSKVGYRPLPSDRARGTKCAVCTIMIGCTDCAREVDRLKGSVNES